MHMKGGVYTRRVAWTGGGLLLGLGSESESGLRLGFRVGVRVRVIGVIRVSVRVEVWVLGWG